MAVERHGAIRSRRETRVAHDGHLGSERESVNHFVQPTNLRHVFRDDFKVVDGHGAFSVERWRNRGLGCTPDKHNSEQRPRPIEHLRRYRRGLLSSSMRGGIALHFAKPGAPTKRAQLLRNDGGVDSKTQNSGRSCAVTKFLPYPPCAGTGRALVSAR